MLTSEKENYILTHAYIPEHSVGLIKSLSQGEPYLIDDCFFCRKEDWIILVGYPLLKAFTWETLETVLEKIKKEFRPRRISLIAPELSPKLSTRCNKRESDFYYTMDTGRTAMGSEVRRNIKKATQSLNVERSTAMGGHHQGLMEEFVDRVCPPFRVKDLLFKMPRFVEQNRQSVVLNAWDAKNRLAAFYVVDLAAKRFSNYIIGCHSKKHYVLGASDLLLFELIKLSQERDKEYVHLGLGVNSGVRRFKEKWGGKPFLAYEMCELVLRRPLFFEIVNAFQKT
jgi:hypothetical protein